MNTDKFFCLGVAVLTVSDTRDLSNDSSGDYLSQAVVDLGHQLIDRSLLKDNKYQLRAQVSAWVANPDVHIILITGGTGFAARDVTPEAITPLFDKDILGFGELFRAISLQEIGTATVQSRACAGLANNTLIFALPGSTGACKTAWQKILCEQLDSRHKPCNFVSLYM